LVNGTGPQSPGDAADPADALRSALDQWAARLGAETPNGYVTARFADVWVEIERATHTVEIETGVGFGG